MQKHTHKKWPFVILVILAFFTHTFYLAYPSELVFDEVYFTRFVSAYSTGQYYFDVHPPFGKILIAGFAKTMGAKLPAYSEKAFFTIGARWSTKDLFILRFLPALFGFLLIILIYKLVLLLGLSQKSALLAGFLLLFDNALLVQSKFVLLDILLVFFGFLGLYLFFWARKYDYSGKKGLLFLIFSALALTFSFSMKWSGLSFLGLVFIIVAVEFFKKFDWKSLAKKILVFLLVIPTVYFSIFAIHFALLPFSGSGDVFMSAAFQRGLEGSQVSENIEPLSLGAKFIELNKTLYKSQVSVTSEHSGASRWYERPFGRRPIWYWSKNTNQKVANIYLFANPMVWWLAGLGTLISIVLLLRKKTRAKTSPLLSIFLLAYFMNILPYILIERCTFLYHYLPPLVFGILAVSVLSDQWLSYIQKNKKKKKHSLWVSLRVYWTFYISILVLAMVIFLVLLPLTYGFRISRETNEFYSALVEFFS